MLLRASFSWLIFLVHRLTACTSSSYLSCTFHIDPHSSQFLCAKAPSLSTTSRSRCCNGMSVFTLNESNSARDRMWPNLTQHLSEQQGHLISACASSIRMTHANSLVYIHKTSTHHWLLVISLAWMWLCIFKLFAPGVVKDWKSYRHVPPFILSYLEYIRKKKMVWCTGDLHFPIW